LSHSVHSVGAIGGRFVVSIPTRFRHYLVEAVQLKSSAVTSDVRVLVSGVTLLLQMLDGEQRACAAERTPA
jgi:hypothetical protein